MDAIGESVENVGLAQEIQKGLAKSLQRPPKFAEWQADIDAKKAELSAMEGWDCYSKHRMVKNCVIAWAKAGNVDLSLARRRSSAGQAGDGDKPPTEGGVKANWDDFKASSAMDICCKYIVAADKVYAEPVSPKQFEEMRALGKGAFGAVFLTFKKDTGAPFAVKKCVKTIAKENKMIKDVLIEREVLSKMRSPFCVCLNYAFQDKDVIYLVLTLCPGGDLGFLLQKQWSDAKKKEDRVFKPFPDGAVKFYAASMALGLQAITTPATSTVTSSRRTCCSTPKASCASLTWDLPLTFPRARSSSAQAPAATGRLRRSTRRSTPSSRTGGLLA